MSAGSAVATLSCDGVYWTDLLNKTRDLLKEDKPSDALDLVRPHFGQIRDLLQAYSNLLQAPKNGSITTNASKEDKKKLVLDTRAGLRVALSCSSIGDDDDGKRRYQILHEVISKLAWHEPILQLLMSQGGDAKCRVLASQLLSNLVTAHSDTAELITSHVALAPSSQVVADRIRQGLEASAEQDVENGETGGKSSANDVKPNWMDMMLVCAHTNNRDALAGVVAALHNSIASLRRPTDKDSFDERVASDKLLVSTLLRQIVPVQSVKAMIDDNKHGGISSDMPPKNLADSATEWISLILIKLCKLGRLPQLISSVSGNETREARDEEIAIFPEHVVLLQCICTELDAPGGSKEIVLGGEAGEAGVISTHLSLARLCVSLRKILPPGLLTSSTESTTTDSAMNYHALVTTLEILAASLGQEGDGISPTRQRLGQGDCTLLPDAGIHLGALVDAITYRNEGRKSRDFVMLEEEKRVITALVRLIGNACFRCRQNQELLRLTLVPIQRRVISDDEVEERNALHVLLSCTSLAHSCFTLREWAVIAIRNVLDDNETNQAVVAELEANKPIQSAELASLGIRVDMDSKGNVKVVPSNDGQT